MKKSPPSPSAAALAYPVTPDGRYFVVRGRLWRTSNPSLAPAERERLVKQLMKARSDLRRAGREDDPERRSRARGRVQEAKVALGERGAVWWSDGSPDYNQRMAVNTPWKAWFERGDDDGGPR